MKLTCLTLMFGLVALGQTPPPAAKLDFPNLARYHDENAKLPPAAPDEKRVVFMGDSITDNWGRRYGKFFPGKPYVNRGIGGQTPTQMLVRVLWGVIAVT